MPPPAPPLPKPSGEEEVEAPKGVGSEKKKSTHKEAAAQDSSPPKEPPPNAAPSSSDEEKDSLVKDKPANDSIFKVVCEEGAIICKLANLSSTVVGKCPLGETLTCTDASRVWCPDNDTDEDAADHSGGDRPGKGFWRVQVKSPLKWRGWVSLQPHIIRKIEGDPQVILSQSMRKKAEALHGMTKSMVEVSLVAARHSAQLRSQRAKVRKKCVARAFSNPCMCMLLLNVFKIFFFLSAPARFYSKFDGFELFCPRFKNVFYTLFLTYRYSPPLPLFHRRRARPFVWPSSFVSPFRYPPAASR